MPREPRAFFEGIYHLASHASDRRYLFSSDGERETFLGRLGLIFERFELRLVAYTLMGNHYHLVLVTPDARVSKAPGLASDPFAWRWSSAAASAGLQEPALSLDGSPLRAALGDSSDWPERYRAFIADG
jgi:hypothetical protein